MFLQRRLAMGRRRHLPTGVAIGIAYLVIIGAIGVAIAWLVPHVTVQVTKLAENAPDRMRFASTAGQSLSTLQSRLHIPGLTPSMIEHATTSAMAVIDSAARAIAGALVRAASFVPWLVLVPILAFFLLKDAETFRQGAIALMPERWRTDAAELLDRINSALAAFIRAQLVSCLFIGTVIGIGFAALGVPSAMLFGIGAGIAEFVPLVGPLVFAAVSAVVAATRVHPMLAVWVLLFLGVLRIAQDYIIYPRLVGRNIHLHPLAVIVAVLCGAELGGVAGVLLSVPVLAIITAAYRYYSEERGQ
jgi:predicted PurR-regulated permease PerM